MRGSRHPLAVALLVCAAGLFASQAAAQGNGKGHDKDRGEQHAAHGDRGRRGDNDEDRAIREYYSNPNLPPGLAKRESLPPGLARQLRRNGTLPPGLAKRAESVPDDLDRRLPPLQQGWHRQIIGDRIVTYEDRTRRIRNITVIPRQR